MADPTSVLLSFPRNAAADASLSDVEYDRQVREFLAELSHIPGSTLAKGSDTDTDLLKLLDPSVNSLSYLHVLLAQIQAQTEKPRSFRSGPTISRSGSSLWKRTVRLLEKFDPIQIRYAGAEWRKLLEYTGRVARLMDQPAAALAPIRHAMLRLDPSTGTLTTTHVHYMRLCLEAKAYRDAIPILENQIHSFPSATSSAIDGPYPCSDHQLSSGYITYRSGLTEKLSTADVHEYFILGAMVYTALQRYNEALSFLEHVLVAPTQNVASGLMLEAYRKWLLIGCLVEGKPLQTPKAANSAAIKTMKAASRAYEAVAEIFHSQSLARLRAEVAAGSKIWNEDGNAGLVHQLLVHHPRFAVTKLQKLYAAVTIPAVAELLGEGYEQTEAYLNSLIRDGYLNATVEHLSDPSEPAVLRFHPNLTTGPLAKSEKNQYEELLAQTRRTNELAEYVRAADQRLSVTKEYIEHLRKKQRAKENKELSDLQETMQVDSWGVGEQDEDMMADLQ